MKEASSTKIRFDEIDICKGIAILGVLLAHSFIVYPVNIHDLPWCQHALGIISTYYLVVFFVISGYLISGTKKSFSENLYSKSKRLLLPYFSYAILNYIVKICAPSLVNNKVESFSSYLFDVFFFGGELWFLYTLFIISIIWSIILPQIKKRNVIILLVILLLIIDGFINEEPETNIFLYTYFVHYSVFFSNRLLFTRNWRPAFVFEE